MSWTPSNTLVASLTPSAFRWNDSLRDALTSPYRSPLVVSLKSALSGRRLNRYSALELNNAVGPELIGGSE